MPTYKVHIYREMRLMFPGIAAETAEAALKIAQEKSSMEATEIEDCYSVDLAAVVDLEGDEEYVHSKSFTF